MRDKRYGARENATYEEQLARLRAELQIGIDQLERGEYREYDSEGLARRIDEIIAEARRELARSRKGGSPAHSKQK